MHSERDLLRWSEALSAIARTGLGFTDNLYERERFEEVLAVAAEIRASCGGDFIPDQLVDEWMKQVGQGVAGYVTPKSTVGAVVHNDVGELLLVQRRDSGVWLYPTYTGDIYVNGEKRQFANTKQAEEAGVPIIYQELNLIPEMTVAAA